MNKRITIKTFILLNNLYFLFTCITTAKSWYIDFSGKTDNNDVFNRLNDSVLLEEYGVIIYLTSLILFFALLTFKPKLKKIWTLISLIPVLILILILCYIKYL